MTDRIKRTAWSTRRRRLVLLSVLVLATVAAGVFALTAFGATPPPSPTITSGPPNNTTQRSATFSYSEAYGSNISMGPQAMQGDLKVTAGDWLNVGFQVSYPGQHPALTVNLQNNTFTFAVNCVDNSTPTQSTFVVTAPNQSYSVPANNTGSFPAGGGAAAATYQGGAQLPALCGSKANNIELKTGGTFTSLLSGTDTTDKVQIQWHYVDAAVAKKSSGNINCSLTAQNPDPGQTVCNGGWSGTLNTVAGTAASAISFQCQLDGSGFSPCGNGSTGTITYPGPLSVNTHTFQVEAIVASAPSAPASYNWTIIRNSPTLSLSGPGSPGTTTAGTTVPASSITATLGSAYTPATGAITFTALGPSASAPSNCTSGATTIGTASVSTNGTYHPSAGFTPTAVGNYWLYASYPGDANNNSAASACPAGAPQEIVVGKANPSLGASASGSGVAGTAVAASSFSAALSNSSGSNATGTITFTLFGPSTGAPSTCTGSGISLGTASVLGNNTYTASTGFTPHSAGNYWLYASYGGDSNNNNANSACPPTAAQKFVVAKASPTLTVNAPSNVSAGGSATASQLTATLAASSGINATSQITFTVFGPSTSPPATCTIGGTTVGTVTPGGDGAYHPNAGWTPDTAGTYWWYVSSPADANNNAAASTCNNSSMTNTVVAGPTKQLTISGNAVGTLFPGGAAQAIAIQFTNPNGVAVDVTSLTVTVGSTGAVGCSAGDFQITQSNISASNRFTVPANGSATIPASGPVSRPTIRMIDNGVQNACRNAHLTLNYSSS
jgi:hypothetical protein